MVAPNFTEIPIPVLDSSQFGWKNSFYMDYPNQIVIKSASLADFVPLNIPIASQDWSYDMQLFGPTLKCRAANSSEQASFDQLKDQLQRKNLYTLLNTSTTHRGTIQKHAPYFF